jgi:hypothetical protein
MHRGAPDRRLIHGADGSACHEFDPVGDGHFVAGEAVKAATTATPRLIRP